MLAIGIEDLVAPISADLADLRMTRTNKTATLRFGVQTSWILQLPGTHVHILSIGSAKNNHVVGKTDPRAIIRILIRARDTVAWLKRLPRLKIQMDCGDDLLSIKGPDQTFVGA